MKTSICLSLTTLVLFAPLAAEADEPAQGNRFDRRSERVERAYDRKDTRNDRRYDRAIGRAEASGRDGLAARLETREGRIDATRDRREERLTGRLEQRSGRLEDWRNR